LGGPSSIRAARRTTGSGKNKERDRVFSSASLRNLFQAFSIENVAMLAQGWMCRGEIGEQAKQAAE